MRLIRIVTLISVGTSLFAAEASKDDAAFLASLPDVKSLDFSEQMAVALAAMPLACLDRPQAAAERADYLWLPEGRARIADNYVKTRAFYGCYDWHSAVNSTWTLVNLSKRFPKLPVGALIREKLKEHFARTNIEGEAEFFRSARQFELPYGYSWLLKLYAELDAWDDPDAKTWTTNLYPLAQQFSKKLHDYYRDLPLPVRGGAHPNTAFTLYLALDYAEPEHDEELAKMLKATAIRFFGSDHNCGTAYEPQGSDFLSPCLAEAQLMSRVLEPDKFLAWVNAFLPPLSSVEFMPLTKPVDTKGITKEELQGGKSHLIGLAFSRAHAMMDIAAHLPKDDTRVAILRRLSSINAASAYDAMEEAGYLGSHWIGTYAVMYLRAPR
jgi:hypothetical protein